MTNTAPIILPYPPPESRFFRLSRGQRVTTDEAERYIYLARITVEGRATGTVESVSLSVWRPTWRQDAPARQELIVLLSVLEMIGINCTGHLSYAPVRVSENDPRVEMTIRGKESR